MMIASMLRSPYGKSYRYVSEEAYFLSGAFDAATRWGLSPVAAGAYTRYFLSL
jgi:hypothetical protein